MVTDRTAYIGTSNWSGDYFINTAGIGLVMQDNEPEHTVDRIYNGTATNTTASTGASTIRSDLAAIFMRDWDSMYAVDLIK